ncbi:DUF2239 family protein [Sphaerotilaceae bacterium SBD11-9]
MSTAHPTGYTAFDGPVRLACGSLEEAALAVKRAVDAGTQETVWVFDDTTGRSLDLNFHGTADDVLARVARHEAEAAARQPEPETPADDAAPRGRGRPKLGVVAREVTLLPRHWEWLAAQPGGASVALRKLVEAARKQPDERKQRRQAQERAYHFMSALAGNFAGFEEASRALFADDLPALRTHMAEWPRDVREHVLWLRGGENAPTTPS